MFILLLIVGVVISVISYILVKKWHDKKVKEYLEMKERAIAGGCPMFSSKD
jgi:hypothetical protein